MKLGINKTNPREFGVADFFSDTSLHTGGPWGAITANAAAVANLVASNWTGTLTAVPIPAGCTIYGHFTSITLASGSVTCYRK